MTKIVFAFVVITVATGCFYLMNQRSTPIIPISDSDTTGDSTQVTESQDSRVAASSTTEEQNEPTVSLPKTDDEWKKILTPEQYDVARKHGTERAFSGKYWDSKKEGTYVCVCCGQKLFSSDAKYKSGTGWPSFWKPYSSKNVATQIDRTLFSVRTEVHCSRCEAHLGHVFEDGPQPSGLRYCMNSASLVLNEKQETSADKTPEADAKKMDDHDQ